jgi:SAM-dependent methyltransferase
MTKTSDLSGKEFSPDQLRETTCAWCGLTESSLLFEGPDRLERLPGVFQIVQCKSCGLIRQNPRLTWDKLKEYYPEDYAAYHYETKPEQKPSLRNRIQEYGNWKRRKNLEAYISAGKLLEVGCGTGAFLRELKKTSRWEVIGIEPSKTAAAYARQMLNSPVYEGRFSDIPLPVENFDVVVMFCVLEHLEDPIEDLRRAHTLLKNEGYLIFTIPNYESLGSRIFGRYWSGWDLPRHLYIFPYPVLKDILTQLGFEIVARKCLATSYHALGHSLEFWSQSWEANHPRLKRIVMSVYYSWVLRLGLVIPLSILDQLKLCTNITYFVRKTS